MVALFINLRELVYAVRHKNINGFVALKSVIEPTRWRLGMNVTRTIVPVTSWQTNSGPVQVLSWFRSKENAESITFLAAVMQTTAEYVMW